MSFTPFEDFPAIKDAVDAAGIPDFSAIQNDVIRLDVDIPEDPAVAGLNYTKAVAASILGHKQVLTARRSEAIAIRSEWQSLRVDFNRVLSDAKAAAMRKKDYKEKKNKDERDTYIADATADISRVGDKIDQAILRCQDFLEVCRIKSGTLDVALTSIKVQTSIIDIQARIGEFTPENQD